MECTKCGESTKSLGKPIDKRETKYSSDVVI